MKSPLRCHAALVRRVATAILGCVVGVGALKADEPFEPGHYERLIPTLANGQYRLTWNGYPGRVYFIQATADLVEYPWVYVPMIEQGAGASISYGFWLTDPPQRFFWRLRHPWPDVTVANPYDYDFAGENIPAGWRLENNLNPFDSVAADYPPGSSLTNLELYQLSLDSGGDPAAANEVGLAVSTP